MTQIDSGYTLSNQTDHFIMNGTIERSQFIYCNGILSVFSKNSNCHSYFSFRNICHIQHQLVHTYAAYHSGTFSAHQHISMVVQQSGITVCISNRHSCQSGFTLCNKAASIAYTCIFFYRFNHRNDCFQLHCRYQIQWSSHTIGWQ